MTSEAKHNRRHAKINSQFEVEDISAMPPAANRAIESLKTERWIVASCPGSDDKGKANV